MSAWVIDPLAALPAVVWIAAVLLRARAPGTRAHATATVLAVVVSYLLAHVNRWFGLWPAHPNFPSGHETFASCVSVMLVQLDSRFLWLVVPILAVLGYLLVVSGWHSRSEVLGGFVLGVAVAGAALQGNRAAARRG